MVDSLPVASRLTVRVYNKESLCLLEVLLISMCLFKYSERDKAGTKKGQFEEIFQKYRNCKQKILEITCMMLVISVWTVCKLSCTRVLKVA